MVGEEYVVTSVRVEKWKLEAAKKAGINISEVVRRALDLALAARSRSVSAKDVVANEEVVEVVKEEYLRELEEAEREEEERRKRMEELQRRMKEEEELRRRRRGRLQAEELKRWLRKHRGVCEEIMEYLREGISENEIYMWLMNEKRAPFVLVKVFKEVLRWLREEYARELAEKESSSSSSSSSSESEEESSSASEAEAGREEAEEEAREMIKRARSILEGY